MTLPGARHPWWRALLSVTAFLLAIWGLSRWGVPSWVLKAVQYGFTGWLIYLVGDGFSRYRLVWNPPPGRMVQPPFVFWVGAVCALLFGALEVWCLFWPNESVSAGVLAVFGVFVALGLYLMVDARVTMHRLTDEVLVHRNWVGLVSRIPWTDVVEVRWHPLAKLFRVRSRGLRPVWVWGSLSSQPEFATQILRQADAAVTDSRTRSVLVDATEGRLPPGF
jgi:hypothetical protein